MRVIIRLVFVLYILFGFYSIAQEKKSDNRSIAHVKDNVIVDAKPVLTDAQKLEIRSAQVALFQAKEVLESTPQFQAFQRAQSNLNETALKIQRESKVDPAKWTLGQDLNYVAVPQPAKEKK